MPNDTTNACQTASTSVADGGRMPRLRREIFAPYASPDLLRGALQLVDTGVPFVVLMAAMLYAFSYEIWLGLVLIVPTAALLVRLFMIQHDCGHQAFFRSRWANDLIGRTLGILTLTPYTFWLRAHAAHHATAGNLNRRGVGDIDTLTVREYLSRSSWGRLMYRMYRHPAVLFGIGPAYQFLIRHRIPTGHPVREWKSWFSILGTNVALALITLTMAMTVGLRPFLIAYLPVVLLSAQTGVWLFYLQHQFEDTYWETETAWDFQTAALEGCSFYDLPGFLHWVTGHIGFHHIHHLSSKVPNYRLRDCFRANPELWKAKRLTLLDSLKCPGLALWDEESRKLVSFRHVRRLLQRADRPS